MNCKACRYFAEINGMCRRYPAHEAIERPETHWCGEFANELTEVTPKQVETAVNALWKGRTLMTPIGGGVNIQPRQAISPEHLMQDENGQVARARQETAPAPAAKVAKKKGSK